MSNSITQKPQLMIAPPTKYTPQLLADLEKRYAELDASELSLDPYTGKLQESYLHQNLRRQIEQAQAQMQDTIDYAMATAGWPDGLAREVGEANNNFWQAHSNKYIHHGNWAVKK